MNRLVVGLVLLLQAAAGQFQLQTGTVTGRIRTAAGTPVVGVRVVATAVDAAGAFSSLAQTDANGSYRLADIPPGRYWIAAGPVDRFTYFPGVTGERDATAVNVTAGSTLSAIDFAMAAASARFRVRGKVVASNVAPSALSGVLLVLERPGETSHAIQFADLRPSQIGADGAFEFANVAPGSYAIMLIGSSEPLATVEVLNDISDLRLPLPLLGGQVVMEKGGLPPGLSMMHIHLRSPISARVAPVAQDGAFAIPSGPDSGPLSVSSVPLGYRVRSIMQGQVDLTRSSLSFDSTEPVRVVLTDEPVSSWYSVRGKVVNLPRASWIRSPKVRFSSENANGMDGWWESPLNADGSFEFPKLAAGTYAVAVMPADPVGPQSPIVVVDRDLRDIIVPLPVQVGVRARVTVVNERGATFPSPGPFGLEFRSERLGVFGTAAQNGLDFRILLPPETYTVTLSQLPPRYSVTSIRAGNIDVLSKRLKLDASTPEISIEIVVTFK